MYVNVYWDVNCSEEVTSIDWGELTPGTNLDAQVFVRNEDLDEPCYVYLITEDWIPVEAVSYITLTWNYDGASIAPMETKPITLTIRIASSTYGITGFNFSIIFLGCDFALLGDINFDTHVNIKDTVLLGAAFSTAPDDPAWNPNADLNDDDYINLKDAIILNLHFDEHLE